MRDLNRLRSKYELRLDNRQIAYLLIGELVILAMIFSLGVVIGKRLGRLSGNAPLEELTPLAAQPATTPDALSLSNSLGGPIPAQTPTQVVDLTPTQVAAPLSPTPTEPATPPSSADLAPAVEGAPPQPPAPAISGDAAPPAGSYWTVQVGSFPDQTKAQELRQKLAAGGNQVYLETTDVPGVGTRYRVLVGHFENRGAADAVAGALRQRENIDTWVRRYPAE
jgi:cell division septation protein DedD